MGCSILIVDDHTLFSTSLMMALRVSGLEASQVVPVDHGEILARAAAAPPGLVVLDLLLGNDADGRLMSGAELVTGLRRLGWQVLIVSGSRNEPGKAAAVAAGALGVLPKTTSFDVLLDAVVTAASGRPLISEVERQTWVARHHRFRLELRDLEHRLDRLTPREREVLELLAKGFRVVMIVERSMVSVTTVRTQIRSILNKLEVTSQLEAVAMLRRLHHHGT